MRIVSKLNIVVLAVLAASVAANYAVLKATIQPRFDDIELKRRRQEPRPGPGRHRLGERSAAGFSAGLCILGFLLSVALGNEVSDFVASTLTPAPRCWLENVSVDAAVFLDRNRNVLWAAGIDGSSGASAVGLVPDLLGVKYRHPISTARAGRGDFRPCAHPQGACSDRRRANRQGRSFG